MSNLPVDPYDRTVIVEPAVDNPDRAPLAGTGRDIVVTLWPADQPGREMAFLSASGKWVPFTTTEFTTWGGIIGDITDQADLMALFAEYTKTTEFATVAFTGNYNDLTNKPPLGTVSPLNLNGSSQQFLRGDGVWAIPVDIFAVWGQINGTITDQNDLMALFATKAPINNPTFTGLVNFPTPPVDDSSTRGATTAWFFGQAFNTSPTMNADPASSGASTRWARGDHRHPVDTSRAPLDTPAFIGLPTAPTPAYPNNSTRIATTAYVTSAIAAIPAATVAWGSITGTLSAQTDLNTALNLKAPLASPIFTGDPRAPTPLTSDNDTSIATTAFVKAAIAAIPGTAWGTITGTLSDQTDLNTALGLKAPLASPLFTGDPRAPTPAAADNDTSIATTAFVKTAIAASGGVSPPPSDGNTYGYKNGAWVVLDLATKWDKAS